MANKNVNDSKIKTHILTKKVQLIVDTDRFDTDEEKKAEVDRVYKYLRDSMRCQSREMNQYYMHLWMMSVARNLNDDRYSMKKYMNNIIDAVHPYLDKNNKEFNNKQKKITRDFEKKIKNLCEEYQAETEILNNDTLRELNKCFNRKKDGAYDTNFVNEMPEGLGIVMGRTVEQDFQNDCKAGLLSGIRNPRSYKINYPLIIPKSFVAYGVGSGKAMQGRGIIFPDMEYSDFHNMLFSTKKPNITYNFVHDIDFKLVFGSMKRSHELRVIFDRIKMGEYSICGSTIEINNKKKIMLNLSYEAPIYEKPNLDENTVVGVDLGMAIPAVCSLNNDDRTYKYIGDSHELEFIKKGIQAQRRSYQRNAIYNKGGHGRNRKLENLDRLKKRERNTTRTHNQRYAKQIVDFALANNAKYINLENLKGFSNNEKNKLVLRNWCYYELQQYIEIDASKYGIKVRYIYPMNTSRTCSVCGTLTTDEDVKNGVGRVSQDEFICKDPNCPSHTLYTRGPKGHKVPYFNADRNASRNIAMSEDFVKKNAKDNAFKKIDDLYEINNDIDAA